jgi:flavorubredoxin
MKTEGYDRPIQIAEGIFWVGFHDPETNLHCNPYLVVEGDRAVLIDGGSRPDFAVVMTKILQAGVLPERIVALVYQHYDPDLCGSMANLIALCRHPELRIVSDGKNHTFITYYIGRKSRELLLSIETLGRRYDLNGRKLMFFPTPYAHSPGSFITLDERTGTLFTGDLFGSYSSQWEIFLELSEACYGCEDYRNCPEKRPYCPLPDLLEFNRTIMPSGKALRYAMDVVRVLPVRRIAPQHGSILTREKDIAFVIERLAALERVGIDAFTET